MGQTGNCQLRQSRPEILCVPDSRDHPEVLTCLPNGKAQPLKMCNPDTPPFQNCIAVDHPETEESSSMLSSKGVMIWASNVDELVQALPFEIDADVEHLHTMAGAPAESGSARQINFARDVGVHCEKWRPEGHENMDNYMCVQFDDLANSWGVYSVASGQGPQGHLITALIAHELPGLLVQNALLHSDSNLALYQSFVRVGEMIGSCQFLNPDVSGATLTAILMRARRLHVAWIGDSKVVVGRLAEDVPKLESFSKSQVYRGPPPAVKHVEITRDHRFDQDPDSRPQAPSPEKIPRDCNLEERDLSRALGHRTLELSSQPEVRQYQVYELDVFVIVGSYALWQQLRSSEAVEVVRQNMHRTAVDAARALIAEAKRRFATSPHKVSRSSDGITALVVYLRGEKFVSEHARSVNVRSMGHTQHLLSSNTREDANHKVDAGFPQCACLPEVSRRPQSIPNNFPRH